MRKAAAFLAICYLLITLPALMFAETIILKSGETVNGTVIAKDDKQVTVNFKGASITYHGFEIASIDGHTYTSPASNETEVVSAQEYLNRGIAFHNKGGLEEAIANFEQSIKINATNPEAYLNRGITFMDQGSYNQAMADYNKTIELSPKNEEAYFVRGLTYVKKDNLDLAVADYDKAIELNPNYIQAYLNRGFINVNRGDPEKAILDASKVIKINPNLDAAYYVRGIAYSSNGNFDQAIADYTKTIEINPKYSEAYVNRALAYVNKNEIPRNDPYSPRTFLNIEFDYSNKADSEKALSDCNKAIEISPSFGDAYIARAKVYSKLKDFDKAWEDVHKVQGLGFKIDPKFIADLKKISGREK